MCATRLKSMSVDSSTQLSSVYRKEELYGDNSLSLSISFCDWCAAAKGGLC